LIKEAKHSKLPNAQNSVGHGGIRTHDLRFTKPSL
jgi:hypothetical protein